MGWRVERRVRGGRAPVLGVENCRVELGVVEGHGRLFWRILTFSPRRPSDMRVREENDCGRDVEEVVRGVGEGRGGGFGGEGPRKVVVL